MTAIRSEGPVATDRTFEPEAGASGLAEDRFGATPQALLSTRPGQCAAGEGLG